VTEHLLDQVIAGDTPLAVVGLGYVGLPVAVAFARGRRVLGIDISEARVRELNSGHDGTGQIPDEELAGIDLRCSTDPSGLSQAGCIIVAVPTPIDEANNPDLGPLLAASRTVGEHLRPGATVVYESTVYPGATEEDCVPELESASGLQYGRDFFVGYSPERINPGDRVHTLETVTKVVSACDDATLDRVARLYESIVEAGVHRAPSIATAEAAKVIENTQRDLNIALVNELALIFERMDLDTGAVLEAAGTKWNFLHFHPGLVGGHCIGVDPYYLTHKAQRLGYLPQVVLAGRRINDSMGRYVAQRTVRRLVQTGGTPRGARALVLGLSFKENLGDLRNTRVVDLIQELEAWGIEVRVHDPWAKPEEARRDLGLELLDDPTKEAPFDVVVVAVAHRQFGEAGVPWIVDLCKPGAVVADVKRLLDPAAVRAAGLAHWRL
jgi:UDP-N-acetyl-D-galactosamine dehydrogenase